MKNEILLIVFWVLLTITMLGAINYTARSAPGLQRWLYVLFGLAGIGTFVTAVMMATQNDTLKP